jgi:heavy metal sensor kinase
VKSWWERRSLKLRLAVWFTAAASGILLGLTPAVYWLIEHRLHVEFDRQLHLDWDSTLSRLEADHEGRIVWNTDGPPKSDDFPRTGTPFEIWKEGHLVLRHWTSDGKGQHALPPPRKTKELFQTFASKAGDVRAMDQETVIGGNAVTLRVFRDESGLHRTLREILAGFALSVPIAAVLSAFGGYLMAGRMLKPITLIVERARQITSESLDERLPNPNPHDELGQMATVFNETLLRLQQSFDGLKRFTADASHELRTPLTALRSVGEVGLREADPAALRETIGSMLEEAQHLNDLIDSLLVLTRVENGRSPLQIENLHLGELASEVRERVGVLAAEKEQEIELIVDPDSIASADETLTRQAVMNILDNAIRYSAPGRKISMRTFLRNSEVGIEISDQGPGIAPEYSGKIFERFFRIDKARTRRDGGAGLGLAIAKLSVEQQGGTIELQSRVGEGSTFRVLLPRHMEGSAR